jgi:hypothetical protein
MVKFITTYMIPDLCMILQTMHDLLLPRLQPNESYLNLTNLGKMTVSPANFVILIAKSAKSTGKRIYASQ